MLWALPVKLIPAVSRVAAIKAASFLLGLYFVVLIIPCGNGFKFDSKFNRAAFLNISTRQVKRIKQIFFEFFFGKIRCFKGLPGVP
jgi:hypothetical protein